MAALNSLLFLLTTLAPFNEPQDYTEQPFDTKTAPWINDVESINARELYHSYSCPRDEVYSNCGSACPRDCSNWHEEEIPCTQQCLKGCFCKDGMVRGPLGKCVFPDMCPGLPKCPPREKFDYCKANCQRNCSNWDQNVIPCPTVCIPGCVCEEELVRGPDGKCIRHEECEVTAGWNSLQTDECPSNEEYLECGTACPSDCSNWQDDDRPCTQNCVSGCFCKLGMVRGPDGLCILPRQCPSMFSSDECPSNEEYLDCGTACPSDCSNWQDDDRPCTQDCVSGCFCKKGMVRGPDDRCISPRQCPSTFSSSWELHHSSECPSNEEYLECGTACPSDCSNWQDKDRPCTKQCVKGCFCKEGMVRSPHGRCIWPRQCPVTSSAPNKPKVCPRHEYFSICGALDRCQKNCSNWNKEDFRCPVVCVPGCVCDKGLVRGPDGRCIEPSYCETTTTGPDVYRSDTCPRNEEYLECGPACPKDCSNWTAEDRSCTYDCTQGCFCKSGMVRGPDGRCVRTSECPLETIAFPKLCPPSERYSMCGALSRCQRDCSNLKEEHIRCPPVCMPGCICEEGLVRGPDGRCIEPSACEATTAAPQGYQSDECPLNEEYSQCGTACPRDCSNWHLESAPCAQECVRGCFCKEGMVRGPRRRCISTHKCPAKTKASKICPVHERYLDCGTACPRNCSNKDDPTIPCTDECVSGCFCKGSRVRGPDGKCIYPSKCPAKQKSAGGPFSKCEKDEVYKVCSSVCPDNCDNYQNSLRPCKFICLPGCECKKGLVRGPDDSCIKPEECTEKTPDDCAENELHKTCGSPCEDDCATFNLPVKPPCEKKCKTGCFCQPGFVRGPKGDCIWAFECPA